MKSIVFTIFLLAAKSALCQESIKVFSENWKTIDSIRRIYEGKISSDSLAQIENMELSNQVANYTLELIKEGIVTYPYGLLPYNLASTYKILLLERHVNFNDYIKKEIDISYLHYSTYYQLMFDFFETKYGKGFFSNVKMQADSLDKLNLGLTLPRISNAENSNDKLKELISKTISKIMREESLENLFLKFKINKSNKVEEVEICKFAWHGLFTLEDISKKYSKQLLQSMNNAKWKHATYMNKYIDKSVIFEFDKAELQFFFFEI